MTLLTIEQDDSLGTTISKERNILNTQEIGGHVLVSELRYSTSAELDTLV
jgi:hypothetical protein